MHPLKKVLTMPSSLDHDTLKPSTSSASNELCPWAELDENGTGLSVDDFLTTVVVRSANALRRHITSQYASEFGLSISQWRLLSVLGQAREMTFPDLVVAAVADKAQVSRTLRLMQERGLVHMHKEGSNPRWQVILCSLTPEGTALFVKAMPMARRTQARMIRQLSVADRVAAYRALTVLLQLCEGQAGLDEQAQTDSA